MIIQIDDPQRDDVLALLREHLSDMHDTSPAESVHALEPEALKAPGVTFWTARDEGVLLGCVALKDLGDAQGELKSMRTTTRARRRGVAGAMLDHVSNHARGLGMRRLSLETGTQDYFAPAWALYRARGFETCGPFGDYALDPHSTFMTLVL